MSSQSPHSLKRFRIGESVTLEPHAYRRKSKTSARTKSSRRRTKRPVDEIPPLHPHVLYRTRRLSQIFSADRTTIYRWRKQKILPPFTVVGGVEGLTGQQIIDFYAQQREDASQS